QHVSVFESCGVLHTGRAFVAGVGAVSVACGFDLSAAARLLGGKQYTLFECGSALGKSVSDRWAVDNSDRWNRALHHGSVFESAESGSVCSSICCSSYAAQEIS